MNPQELYRAGRLSDAIKALSAELRDNPTDARRRTFLFELLCFAGEYERADKQLEVLAQAGPQSEMGVLLYRSALYAERQRQDVFERGEFPRQPKETEDSQGRGGTVNGKSFGYFSDADPRTGDTLEVFAAGNYLLLPLEHVASIEIPAPKKLRDLIWTPAAVRTTPAFQGSELGEVLLPVLAPFSWRHPDEGVRLGRMTVWEKPEGSEYQIPFGQKMWLVDDEEIPFLELRALEFNPASVREDQRQQVAFGDRQSKRERDRQCLALGNAGKIRSVTLGYAMTAMTIHFSAKMGIVIECPLGIMLSSGANSIDIGSTGVFITGTPFAYINSGSSPASTNDPSAGSPDSPQDPKDPDTADDGSKGTKLN